MDENRIGTLARQHGIRQKRDEGAISKTLMGVARRADEGTLSRTIVEATTLLASARQNGTTVPRDAATVYKVDTDAIALKVKAESAAKAKKDVKPTKVASKVRKRSVKSKYRRGHEPAASPYFLAR